MSCKNCNEDICQNKCDGQLAQPSYLTVVYTINDKQAFAPMNKQLGENFQDPNGKPWSVTAMSINDEMTRLELIEAAVEEDDYDAVRFALSSPDIHRFNNLSQLQSAMEAS